MEEAMAMEAYWNTMELRKTLSNASIFRIFRFKWAREACLKQIYAMGVDGFIALMADDDSPGKMDSKGLVNMLPDCCYFLFVALEHESNVDEARVNNALRERSFYAQRAVEIIMNGLDQGYERESHSRFAKFLSPLLSRIREVVSVHIPDTITPELMLMMPYLRIGGYLCIGSERGTWELKERDVDDKSIVIHVPNITFSGGEPKIVHTEYTEALFTNIKKFSDEEGIYCWDKLEEGELQIPAIPFKNVICKGTGRTIPLKQAQDKQCSVYIKVKIMHDDEHSYGYVGVKGLLLIADMETF